MPMPTIASVGAITSGQGARTLAMGVTHAADDIDILLVETANEIASPALSTANGFALLQASTGQGTGGGTDATQLHVFWRRWNGTDGAPTVADAGNHVIARIIHIRGCVTTGDPWSGTPQTSQQTTGTTSGSATGYTTSDDDCLVLICASADLPDSNGSDLASETNANLAAPTIVAQMDNSRNSGNGGLIGMWTGGLATAGATGTTTYNSGATSLKEHVVFGLVGASSGAKMAKVAEARRCLCRSLIIICPEQRATACCRKIHSSSSVRW